MKIETAVREYLIEIEVRKYTPRTIKGYRTNLNLFLRFCKEKSMIKKAAVSDFIGAWGGGQPPTSKRVGIYRAIACYNCQCPKTRVECSLYWCYTLLVIGCQIGNLVEGGPQNVGIA